MTGLIIFFILILFAIVAVQFGKASELAAKIRGEEKAAQASNNRTALWLLIFMVIFLIGCIASAYYYKNSMLGYGPHTSASEHGLLVDNLFNVTLFWTGIVFVITHIALFWFAFKYRSKPGVKAKFMPHNNTLELIWTIVPAIVLVWLVVKGLEAWNEIMPDVGPNEQYIEIEATGYQFAWDLRYPGTDGKIGTKNYKLIDLANNPLGQDWTDEKNIDDFHASELVLPVGLKVRVRITSRDVLHNFYLPHFRVKMDAVPGLPTYFIFTPTRTTEEYRQELRYYPEWQVPADPTEPEGPEKWELFDYELACAELCGDGHYSMKRVVKIVSQDEFNEWAASQPSYYMSNIRGKDIDPFKDQLLSLEIQDRARELAADFERAIAAETADEKTIVLKHVFFKTGSTDLRDDSKYELDNVVEFMNNNERIRIELAGHTDNTGDSAQNLSLSRERANMVLGYLVEKGMDENRLRSAGYGQNRPIETNDTEEGRQKNRRTELRIISQ